MFDAYLIKDGSFQNYEENGETAGFKVDVHIGEYRGCFLSLVRGYYVEVDGVEYPLETQKFEINNKAPRTFEESPKQHGSTGIMMIMQHCMLHARAVWQKANIV